MLTRRWAVIPCAFVLVLAAAGCEVVEEEVPDGGYVDTIGQIDLGVDGTTDPPIVEYRYVMIVDLSDGSGAADGADIDAVELRTSAGSSWAKSVVSCILPDETACTDDDAILGPSDAFCDEDLTRCYSHYGMDDPPPYVALGGTVDDIAGAVVVEMSEPIMQGDTLVVYELGNCAVSSTCEDDKTVNAAAEEISVSIGLSAEGPWVEVLAESNPSDHPEILIPIPALPTD